MDLCKTNNCKVIQYDCNTHCWLLDSCGGEVTSSCGSSVYYRDLTWVAATTTTTTTMTAVLGACADISSQNGLYAAGLNTGQDE